MTSKNQPEHEPRPTPSLAERKPIFLEAFARLGVTRAALREAGVFSRTLRQWRRDDRDFDEAFKEIKRANVGKTVQLPLADKPARNLSPEDRRQIFLDNFAEIGALTLACDAAGVDLRTLNDWLQAERGFREAFNEAKLRYRDRLQSLAMRQITEERDGPMLRFTLQAEFPEKYGKPGKMSKDRPGLTWSDLERMAGEARRLNDAAAPL